MTRAYREIVREAIPRWNRALCDHDCAVHFGRAVVKNAMEVQARGYVPELVVRVDNDCVTFGCVHGGKWPGTVDAYNGSVQRAIRIGGHPGYLEVIFDCCRGCEDGKKEVG